MKNLALGILLALAFTNAALAQECTSRLQGFVTATGYAVKMAKPCQVWVATNALTIPRGEGVAGLLLIAQQGEMAIVGVPVQTKAKLHLTADQLRKLLQLNNDVDYVKVGIDHDGDLFVRSEVHVESITAEEFSATVQKVVAASSKAYEVISSP